jgi:Mg2+/Co2+ transporter CorC
MVDLKNTYQTNDENGNEFIADVSGSVFRPKNGHELLKALKENKQCEIVDTHAFLAAKALEDNQCGFSFSFRLSKWNKGWSGFERS